MVRKILLRKMNLFWKKISIFCGIIFYAPATATATATATQKAAAADEQHQGASADTDDVVFREMVVFIWNKYRNIHIFLQILSRSICGWFSLDFSFFGFVIVIIMNNTSIPVNRHISVFTIFEIYLNLWCLQRKIST